MSTKRRPEAEATDRKPPAFPAWHLALVLAVSAAWESLFLRHGINKLDEGWPLYAAMRLHAGGTLYDDVLWVFPPAHVLPAWIGYGLDPPGFVATRMLYAAFTVALCGAIYVLGTRLTRPSFALLGALLLAVAAPRTHHLHIIFGYRYLVFAVLALLAFDRRLRTGDVRWLLVAGALTGLALAFRLTPAFAVACGIAAGIAVATRDPRRALREGALYAAGLALLAGPVLLYFAWSVGPVSLWREVLVRPLAMLQPLPVPELAAPAWNRDDITGSFITLAFRLYLLLFAGYLVALGVQWVRAARAGRPFPSPLLLAIVVFGAIFYIRSLGRSDEPHLDSAIPPICLLLGHLAGTVHARLEGRWPALRSAGARGLAVAAGFAAWVFLLNVDSFLDPEKLGVHPIQALDGRIRLTSRDRAQAIDRHVRKLRSTTRPGDVILDVGWSPFLHPLTGRLGPGYFDVVMPGTFLAPEEEERFLRRLDARPPAAIFWSKWPFDMRADRGLQVVAPRLERWIRQRYTPVASDRLHRVLVPRGAVDGTARAPGG